LLSANEGIIPKSTVPESFIAFDIRDSFKLPLPKEKIDVFAYHFYRLLQHAQNITLVYNSEADELGGGEKSRFILQLKDELAAINKGIHLTEELLNFELSSPEAEANIVIEKTPEIMKTIAKKAASGFSPSALNSYIQCPLQYYFSRILNLEPPKSIDDSIQSNTFGTIIHEALKELYMPFKKKRIDADSLKSRLQAMDEFLIKALKKELKHADFSTGKNLLLFEVAKKYVRQFVEADIRRLKSRPHQLRILEKKLKTSLNVDGKEVWLKGKIDRVDKDDTEGTVLLADYKTGKVEKKDLKFENWEVLSADQKYGKVFQLLFYTYLLYKNNPSTGKIRPGIFSFRNISAGFISTTFPEEIEQEAFVSEFEKVLTRIISALFDPDTPFTQTEDEKACSWCAYKGICNREGKSVF
jgi:CRISPR/Cas system-associated exonuclease Cas4 (RecB family)